MKWLTSSQNENTTDDDEKPAGKVKNAPSKANDGTPVSVKSHVSNSQSSDVNINRQNTQPVENTETRKTNIQQDKVDNKVKTAVNNQTITSKIKDSMHEDTTKITAIVSAGDEKKKVSLPSLSRIFLLILTGMLAYLSYLGHLTVWLRQLTGSKHIDAVNLHYLTTARDYTADLLGILTESKIVIAVLQSSQGGISFIVDVQVQLGQILSSLFDAINFAWKLTLTSLSSIEFLSLLLETNHFSMSLILTLFFILLGLIICFGGRYQRISQLLTKITTTLGFIVLVTHFLLPYSIYGTAMLSKHVLSSHKSEVYRGYSDLHRQLPQHKRNTGLKDQVKGTVSHFKDKGNNLSHHSKAMPVLSAKHLTLTFIEYLFMPLLIMYLLVLLTKQILNSLHLNKSDKAEEKSLLKIYQQLNTKKLE